MSFGQFIAAASFALTVGTIALAYVVGYNAGTIAVCVPFLEGCTDITRIGMKGHGGFIFRGGMVAAAAILIVWWHVMRVWLAPFGARPALWIMEGFGALGALGLAVGTAVLMPEKADSLWKLHGQGANLFFQAMIVAMNINYWLIWRGRKRGLVVPSFRVKTGLVAVLWAILIAFAVVASIEPEDYGKRVLEWWSTLFICLYFLSAWWDWKQVRIAAG
jgi:hypothetical protein